MPTGFTYASYVQAVITQIPTVITDPNLQTMLPNAIDYAELTLARDLDFLAFHGTIGLSSVAGIATVTVPASVIVLEELYGFETLYLLDGHGNPILDGFGNKIILREGPGPPVSPLSRAAIRAIYSGMTGPPEYFAVIGGAGGMAWTPAMQVLLGPTPDQNYPILAYVTERQETLSATNPATFISTQLPDLFWAASMIFWSSYLKNFGAQSDQPQMAVSWEQEYQRLLKSADREEMRKKFQSSGWQAQNPAPLAAQPRA